MKCSHCDKEFEPTLGQLYCSGDCRLRARKSRKRNKNTKLFTCEQCGREFWRSPDKGHAYRFCSLQCSGAHLRKPDPEPLRKLCVGCGKEFFTPYPNKKYCSPNCSLDRTCHYCLDSFKVAPNERLKDRKWCSLKCWQQSKNPSGVGSQVYMLKTGPYIKLGFTSQPSLEHRLHQIRNASPYHIEVLAARPGTYEQEQELHRGAKQWKHRGDWYEDCADLRFYVDRFFFSEVGDPIEVPESGRTGGSPSLSVSEQEALNETN